MKKWGIPHQKAPEITLLERLVWVRYKTHWWPALLYHSYSELQQHLYDQLDMVLKAQFAMAIMRQMQERRKVKVARLLGRSILEVIEVEEDCYCEFYWHLPNVLPKASERERYGDNTELYIDFHRALDQVEDIIRDVSEENFALMPNSEQSTWLERAHASLESTHEDQSSVNLLTPMTKQQQIPDLPASRSGESKSDSTIATNEASVWDSMMNTMVKSFDSAKKNDGTHKEEIETKLQEPAVMEVQRETKLKESVEEFQRSDSLESSTSTSFGDIQKSNSRSSHYSRSSRASARNIEQKNSILSRSSKKSKDKSGRSSTKSKVSSQDNEKVDNRTKVSQVEETREPSSDTSAKQDSTTEDALVEHSNNENPIHVLPGLEGDDIIPGLSAKVENARSIWSTVLGTMLLQRDEPQRQPQKASNKLPNISEETVLTYSSKKELVDPFAAEGTVQEEAEMAMQKAQENLSFWQRMACHAAD
jgi:hypothetical protein